MILAPGLGVFAAGRTKQDARIAADIAEHTMRAKALANAIGRYTALADGDLFDMEYWSLEQAKLGKAKEPLLAGQVALVTGAAGAIGFGDLARSSSRRARTSSSTDVDARSASTRLSPSSIPNAAAPRPASSWTSRTKARSRPGSRKSCRLYGGLDVLVLNAGIAYVSLDRSDRSRRRSAAWST